MPERKKVTLPGLFLEMSRGVIVARQHGDRLIIGHLFKQAG